MSKPQRSTRRDLWLPVGLAALGVALSLLVWTQLVLQRRESLLGTSDEIGESLRARLAQLVADQVDALEAASLSPAPVWDRVVASKIERIPGLVGVEWRASPTGRPLAVGLVDPAAAVPDADSVAKPAISVLEHGPSGTARYRLFVPAVGPIYGIQPGSHGLIVGHIDIAEALGRALAGLGRDLALTVRWHGATIYTRGEASADPWQRWWRVEREVALPVGATWEIELRPTPALAAARLTPLPHYLLAMMLALSGVLAIMAHQLRASFRRSRFLSATNVALETQGEALGALRDELEVRVQERTNELRDAVAELEAFNHSVSHDLRSPLGAILNFASVLEEDYRDRTLDDEGVALIARIRRSALRATSLLEGLLRLSRAGRASLDVERIPMTDVVRECFALARANEADADVVLVLAELPDAMGDRALVADVLGNLLGNAFKYTRGRPERRIEVSGERRGDECIYEVADNGRGFDMRFATKLFGLFERLHGDDSIEGTGVGLAMVARIIRRHGGRVWADAKPDVGARFSFTLPAPTEDPA